MLQPRGAIRSNQKALIADLVLPIAFVVLVLLFVSIFFSIMTNSSLVDSSTFFCNPDGQVELPWHHKVVSSMTTNGGPQNLAGKTKPYSPMWEGKLFLSITLGFGNMPFSAAKGLDIAWDLVVGRGGQIILGILVYRIFRRSMMLSMEKQSVSIPLFASMTSSALGVPSLWTLVREVSRNTHSASGSRDRSKLIRLLGLAYLIVYVLIFATFVSVMTGYQARLTPYVMDPRTSDLLPSEELYFPHFVVADGDRVGLGNNYASRENTEYAKALGAYFVTMREILSPLRVQEWNLSSTVLNCNRQGIGSGLCSFDQPAGAHNITDFSSKISFPNASYNLSAPPLNITIQQNAPDVFATNSYTLDEGTVGPYYAIKTTAFNQTWIQDKSSCLSLNQYKWGFSSLLLFCFSILTVIFGMVMAYLQWEVYWHSRIDRCRVESSIYGDVVNLAAELQKRAAEPIETMSAYELSRSAKRDREGMRIETDALPVTRAEERHPTGYDVLANPAARRVVRLRADAPGIEGLGSSRAPSLEMIVTGIGGDKGHKKLPP